MCLQNTARAPRRHRTPRLLADIATECWHPPCREDIPARWKKLHDCDRPAKWRELLDDDDCRIFLRNREAFAFDKDNPNTGIRYLPPPPKKVSPASESTQASRTVQPTQEAQR